MAKLMAVSLFFLVCSATGLLKLLANRPRDIGDVQDILFMQGELDETYLNNWAKELGIADRLRSILENHAG